MAEKTAHLPTRAQLPKLGRFVATTGDNIIAIQSCGNGDNGELMPPLNHGFNFFLSIREKRNQKAKRENYFHRAIFNLKSDACLSTGNAKVDFADGISAFKLSLYFFRFLRFGFYRDFIPILWLS